MRLYIAQLNPTIGNFKGNLAKILTAIKRAKKENCDLALFSELVLTGYPPEDFLLHPEFIKGCEKALEEVVQASKGITVVLGTVRKEHNHLYNSAAVINHGVLLGYQDKRLLPTYDVFDEARYFTPGDTTKIFAISNKTVVVTICEDIWHHSGVLKNGNYLIDPVIEAADLKPDLVLNLSASPYHYNKLGDRFFVVAQAAETIGCPVALCNQVGGNDSLIFDGTSVVINPKGEFLAQAKGFEEDGLVIDTDEKPLHPIPSDPLEDLRKALVLGLKDYFDKSGFKKACLGLSGGVDSALVAALAKEALGSDHLTAVAMPSPFSSDGSVTDAEQLAKNLGISLLNIPIDTPFETFLTLLNPYFENKPIDSTEENLQARIRGMILMALSNKHGYLVLSTGNKSELAMGYSTLYGDLAGGLAVIADLTKEKVYQLCRHINKAGEVIPESILTKPPSAELRPNQKDSDTLPPYPLIDGVLTAYIERNESAERIALEKDIPLAQVLDLIQKIHQSEYKRRQAPPGLRVTEKAFAIGRRFPMVQKFY